MKKWFPLLILILFIPLVLASEDSIITFTTQENVSISSYCSTSMGNPCTSSYDCLITTYNPDWTLNYSDINMTYVSDGLYNITLGQYQDEGDYKGFIVCVPPTGDEYNGSTRVDFRIVQSSIKGEFNLLGLVLMFIGTIAFFIFLGFISKNSKLTFASFSIAFIEMIVMVASVYGKEIGNNIDALLRINFLSIFIIGFALAVFAFYTMSLSEATADKRDSGKWGREWK